MSENAPHMVKQVIVYSDDSEKVINYRGVIVDGVVVLDVVEEEATEVVSESPVAEAEEAPVSEEVVAEAPAEAPVSDEASPNS